MTSAILDAQGLRTVGDADATIGYLATDDLLLHRVPLQSVTAAERLEEARMRAIDLAAQPLDELHVAVGPALADGSSWVAIIAADRLRAHLADFAAAGLDPAPLWPAALAGAAGEAGDAVVARLGGQLLFRSERVAGVAEPALLAALGEVGLPAATGAIPDFVPGPVIDGAPDLRQGLFAPRIRWWRQRGFQVAAALLLVLALLLLVVPPWVQAARVQTAVDKMGADLQTIARAAGIAPAATPAATAARLQAARAEREGAALGARLSFLTAAVAAVPGAHVESLRLAPDHDLRLRLGGGADAINQLAAQLQAGPFEVTSHGADVRIGRRRSATSPSADRLVAARQQLADARRDAAILQQYPARRHTAADVAGEFRAAGLEVAVADADGRQQLAIAAVRAGVLLPLIARAERTGAAFAGLRIDRNSDDTLRARLDILP